MRFSVQTSVLGSSIDTPTPWAGTMLAPPFFILPQWNNSRHIVCKQAPYGFFWGEKGVGSIMTKWMKPQEHKNQTLTFLHTVLPTWEQTAKSSKCPTAQLPPAWITGSDKVSQDFSVGISQRTSEFTPSQRQSLHSLAQARLARLNMTFPKWWSPNLVSVPP